MGGNFLGVNIFLIFLKKWISGSQNWIFYHNATASTISHNQIWEILRSWEIQPEFPLDNILVSTKLNIEMQSGLPQKSNLLNIYFQKGGHALNVIVERNFEFMTYLFVSYSC